ncbi:MAG: AMP-binding protein [Paludibacteraceae bacterium]|nr:AMP-binding protein [Paludibacteraceae bacterium]
MSQPNYIKYFEKSFKENWELPALTDYVTKASFSYGGVAEQIAKLHILFSELNIRKEDKIAIVGNNNHIWTITFLAVETYGAIAVPILKDFHPDDIQHIINHSDSTLLFLSDNIWENIDESKLPNIRGIFSMTDFRCLYQGPGETIQKTMKILDDRFKEKYPKGFTKEDVVYAEKDNEELVMISYTSGTTGFSKGVMLSGKNFSANISFALNSDQAKRGFNILSMLPLAHAYGLLGEILAQVSAGSHIHFLNRLPSPKILIKAMDDVRPNSIFLVPLVLEKIYKNQILPSINKTSMKVALNIPGLNNKIYSEIRKKLIDTFGGQFKALVLGGAPLNAETAAFLDKIKFPYVSGYGMTECAPLVAFSSLEEYVSGSAGKLLPCLEVKVLSDDPYKIPGELLIKGDCVMMGYYKNPEATAAALDKDGWLHTGDMGIIDEKKNIFIKGRCKNMLLGPSGQNIYPEAIEAKLSNMPFVSECIVTQKDNKLVALVYPDYAAMDESHIEKEQLDVVMEQNRVNINKELAAYEAITKIIIHNSEFEKTPKKSIKRYLYENLA